MDAAVVELNALTDAIGSAAQHHDLSPISRTCLALEIAWRVDQALIGRVQISRVGSKFGSTGIDPLKHGAYPHEVATLTHIAAATTKQSGQSTI